MIINALVNGLTYEFSVVAVDHAGNQSAAATQTATPEGNLDVAPPGTVVADEMLVGDGYVILQWTDPGDADLNHIQITHDQSGGMDPVLVIAGAERAPITNLTNGTLYTFSIVAVDATGNRSATVTVTGTPDHTRGSVGLTLTLVAPTDEAITFSGDVATLNKSLYDQMTVVASIAGADSYTWYLDGSDVELNQNQVEIASESLAVSVHELVLVVDKGGVMYSAGVQFNVIEN